MEPLELIKREEAEAEVLAQRAARKTAQPFTDAKRLRNYVAALLKNADGPADDVANLRANNDIGTLLDRDTKLAGQQAYALILDASARGYDFHAVKSAPPGVRVETYDDKPEVWPIVGLLPQEWADDLARTLRRDAMVAASRPLVGETDPAGMLASLAEVGTAHSNRVANLVREAYFSGVQRARADWAATLRGA